MSAGNGGGGVFFCFLSLLSHSRTHAFGFLSSPYSPPIFGLDLSPILAFFLLSVLTNATAALGAEMTPEMKKKMLQQNKSYAPFVVKQVEPLSNNGDKLQQPAIPTLGDL